MRRYLDLPRGRDGGLVPGAGGLCVGGAYDGADRGAQLGALCERGFEAPGGISQNPLDTASRFQRWLPTPSFPRTLSSCKGGAGIHAPVILSRLLVILSGAKDPFHFVPGKLREEPRYCPAQMPRLFTAFRVTALGNGTGSRAPDELYRGRGFVNGRNSEKPAAQNPCRGYSLISLTGLKIFPQRIGGIRVSC